MMTRMVFGLLVVVLLTTGVAWAAKDVLAYLVENTSARIVCGDYWLDYMPYDRWALGQGSTVMAMDWGHISYCRRCSTCVRSETIWSWADIWGGGARDDAGGVRRARADASAARFGVIVGTPA